MPTSTFCLEQADECELMARDVSDARLQREWLHMAKEWRLAAHDPSSKPPEEPELD